MGWRAICAGAMLGLAISAGATAATACEELVDLNTQALKEYRDKLNEQAADPLDRLFAFQQLVCSSSPVMRAYAVREGLKAAKDPLVRQQIMFDSLMQKTRIEIELSAGSGVTPKDKEFIKEQSGVWVLPVKYVSRDEGCISSYRKEQCLKDSSLFIRGEKVELTSGATIGEFYLSDSNELIGFVRVRDRSDFGRIPAVIKLN